MAGLSQQPGNPAILRNNLVTLLREAIILRNNLVILRNNLVILRNSLVTLRSNPATLHSSLHMRHLIVAAIRRQPDANNLRKAYW